MGGKKGERERSGIINMSFSCLSAHSNSILTNS